MPGIDWAKGDKRRQGDIYVWGGDKPWTDQVMTIAAQSSDEEGQEGEDMMGTWT